MLPKAKVEGIKQLGGEAIFGPRLYQERWNMVREEVEKNGYTIVHGYEDYDVMAGQGTLGLEILEDLPGVDTNFCSSWRGRPHCGGCDGDKINPPGGKDYRCSGKGQ